MTEVTSKSITERRRKSSRLADIGLSLQDIFFNKDGSALTSDDDDNWTVVKSRATRASKPSSFQKIVQRNMRRILRAPPIFEVSGYLVYAPMRRQPHKDVPVRVIPVVQAGTSVSGMEVAIAFSNLNPRL